MPLPGVHALKYVPIDTATSGDNELVAAVELKRIVVLTYTLVASGAVSVRWKSGASTNLSGAMAFAANGGVAPAGDVGCPQFQTAKGAALVLNVSAAVQVSGHVTYIEVG
jgi:hypothetical protein